MDPGALDFGVFNSFRRDKLALVRLDWLFQCCLLLDQSFMNRSTLLKIIYLKNAIFTFNGKPSVCFRKASFRGFHGLGYRLPATSEKYLGEKQGSRELLIYLHHESFTLVS